MNFQCEGLLFLLDYVSGKLYDDDSHWVPFFSFAGGHGVLGTMGS